MCQCTPSIRSIYCQGCRPKFGTPPIPPVPPLIFLPKDELQLGRFEFNELNGKEVTIRVVENEGVTLVAAVHDGKVYVLLEKQPELENYSPPNTKVNHK